MRAPSRTLKPYSGPSDASALVRGLVVGVGLPAQYSNEAFTLTVRGVPSTR
jgi:hypothetical protein